MGQELTRVLFTFADGNSEDLAQRRAWESRLRTPLHHRRLRDLLVWCTAQNDAGKSFGARQMAAALGLRSYGQAYTEYIAPLVAMGYLQCYGPRGWQVLMPMYDAKAVHLNR